FACGRHGAKTVLAGGAQARVRQAVLFLPPLHHARHVAGRLVWFLCRRHLRAWALAQGRQDDGSAYEGARSEEGITVMTNDPMVSCAWLNERLGAPDIRVLDATWFMPADPRNAKALYEERRIPGAIFFDIDGIADTSSGLPHMLPSPEMFSSRMK